MKILIVLGSPRREGNSETVAEAVKRGAEAVGGEVESVYLNDLQIRPCQACGGCSKTGHCILKDEMELLYGKCDGADRIILVSPIYFYGLSAQAKIFGDRMQAQWARRYLCRERFRRGEGRRGYLVSTAATKGERLFESAILTTRYIFDAMEMEYAGEFLVRGVDEKKAVLQQEGVMERAELFGRGVAE
ncbi:flavodoxin family protein [Desulforhopalus vacuolatus]|uniref:flavodoxin family protein n=1 Tax=Desulforhopalus vacuolatus TaxID=40414 RepID=UPI0019660406|nr:flavodoxin family protein [Desulforhopalus vacuolatus]MBM9519467.1 flavodoxin family protein [Desulforhopalus vacuolatus]